MFFFHSQLFVSAMNVLYWFTEWIITPWRKERECIDFVHVFSSIHTVPHEWTFISYFHFNFKFHLYAEPFKMFGYFAVCFEFQWEPICCQLKREEKREYEMSIKLTKNTLICIWFGSRKKLSNYSNETNRNKMAQNEMSHVLNLLSILLRRWHRK